MCRSGGGGGGSGVARPFGDGGRTAGGRPFGGCKFGVGHGYRGGCGGDADGSGGRDGMGGGELGGGERGGGGGLGWQRSMSSGIRISAASCSSPTVKLGSAAPALLRRLLQRGVRGTTEVGVPTANPASPIGLPRDARLLFIVLVSVAPRSSRRLTAPIPDEGGTVGDLTGSFGSSGANADSETSLLPSAEHSADHSTSIATASTPRCSRSWASTTLTTSITPCASGTDTAVWLSRGIQPATYDSFATSVVLLSTHCAFAHAAGSGSSPVQFSRSRQPSSR